MYCSIFARVGIMHGKWTNLSSLFCNSREKIKDKIACVELIQNHKIERGIDSMRKAKQYNRKKAEGGGKDVVKR